MSSTIHIPDDAGKIKNLDVSKNTTMPWMTKYELNALISLRTLHIARGAPPMVDLADGFSISTNMELRKVAIQELKEKRLPYLIKRPLPNGKHEYWPVGELDLTAVEHLLR